MHRHLLFSCHLGEGTSSLPRPAPYTVAYSRHPPPSFAIWIEGTSTGLIFHRAGLVCHLHRTEPNMSLTILPFRPQLPALSYLEVDKVKREEDAYQNRNTGTPQSLSNTSAAPSPTYQYPSGPPPPYSHAHGAPPPAQQHANVWPGAQSGVHTPPESRRTSEHEKEGAKQGPRQSLPSISEALGVDSQTVFASAPTAPASLQSTHLPPPASGPPTSPSAASRRSYPMEPPQGPASSLTNSGSYSQYPQYRSEAAQRSSYPPPADAARAPVAYPPVLAAQDSKPSLHQPSAQSQSRPPPPPASFSRPPEPSPAYEHPPNPSTGSMAPPSSFPYGYTPYPPRYANPTPPASTSSGPIYQPSTVYGAPQTPSSSGWKSENTARYNSRQPEQANYGDNVKRHLDFYDLEQALNEVCLDILTHGYILTRELDQ